MEKLLSVILTPERFLTGILRLTRNKYLKNQQQFQPQFRATPRVAGTVSPTSVGQSLITACISWHLLKLL